MARWSLFALVSLLLAGTAGSIPPTTHASADDGWPDLGDALLRPGVNLDAAPAGAADIRCTTNYLFRSPDNTTLYLGTASHCLAGRHVGDTLGVAGIPDAASVAYCSYRHVFSFDHCGSTPQSVSSNDFALLAIDPALRQLVHPAVLGWGGPTGPARAPEAGSGVIAYLGSNLAPANTGTAQGVLAATPGDQHQAYLARPGVPGDSGSPLMDAHGGALGVLRGSAVCCTAPGAATATDLGVLLSRAQADAQLEAVLVPWPLLATPAVP